MSASIETDIVPGVPPVRDLAAGAVFLRGPEELIIAWAILLAFAVVSSSVGLVVTVLVVPLAVFMIAIGFVWLAVRKLR